MKRLHLSLFTALICLFASASYAMPMVSSSGVTGLEVDGVLYDIAIGDMGGITAAEAFAGLGLTNDVDPTLAAVNSALAGFLNSQPFVDTLFFDGCDDELACVLLSPTRFGGVGVGYIGSILNATPRPWTAGIISADPAFIGSFDTVGSYAVVSRATAVPAPATIALFGLALAGLGITRRKRARNR